MTQSHPMCSMTEGLPVQDFVGDLRLPSASKILTTVSCPLLNTRLRIEPKSQWPVDSFKHAVVLIAILIKSLRTLMRRFLWFGWKFMVLAILLHQPVMLIMARFLDRDPSPISANNTGTISTELQMLLGKPLQSGLTANDYRLSLLLRSCPTGTTSTTSTIISHQPSSSHLPKPGFSISGDGDPPTAWSVRLWCCSCRFAILASGTGENRVTIKRAQNLWSSRYSWENHSVVRLEFTIFFLIIGLAIISYSQSASNNACNQWLIRQLSSNDV